MKSEPFAPIDRERALRLLCRLFAAFRSKPRRCRRVFLARSFDSSRDTGQGLFHAVLLEIGEDGHADRLGRHCPRLGRVAAYQRRLQHANISDGTIAEARIDALDKPRSQMLDLECARAVDAQDQGCPLAAAIRVG